MNAQRANRLIHETSPYLLQHAHNPVDWHAWGPEALDKARAENRPILLSSLLMFVAYGMVLTAYSLSQVSYVSPAREVGIVMGVLMGAFFLKERFGPGRLVGSSFIAIGLALIALAP